MHVHAQVTVHHSKETWTEVMEAQPVSPHLRMLLGSAFISVLSSGKVRVDSISLAHISTSGELKAEVQLATSRKVTIARSYVTQSTSKHSCTCAGIVGLIQAGPHCLWLWLN